MACWNIEGLYKYKFDFEILNYIEKFDIDRFRETWGVCEQQFQNFIDNYISFSYIRKKKQRSVGRFSGGVTVFVRRELI